MPKQPICTFSNGKTFPGWLYSQLIKRYGYDKAPEILFKIRKADDPVKYCKAGIKAGWIAETTGEQDHNKQYMLDWISTNVKREKPAPKARITKKKKVYKAGKLVKKIGGRLGEPDALGALIGDIL